MKIINIGDVTPAKVPYLLPAGNFCIRRLASSIIVFNSSPGFSSFAAN
jgi:hypothetical protein